MTSVSLSRMAMVFLIVGLLVAGMALGSAISTLRGGGASATPSPSPTESLTATPPPGAVLPSDDVDGEDLERLPRYPGAVRSEYRVTSDDLFRLTAVEYLVEADIDDVRDFYRRASLEHGWQMADIGYAGGEWTYVLVDGSVEALVEIEETGGVIEIDVQVSQPLPTPAPTATPRPATPAPPPPPPPGDDDDDDDDDDDGDDSDDEGGESDG